MRNYRLDTNYAIGLTSTTLFPLRSFRLPVPRVVYRPFQTMYPRGDITRAGDGPISVEWVWDVAHVERIASLIRFLFGDEDTQYADCYVRTDKRVGYYSRPSQAFTTFSGIAWRPLLDGTDGAYENPYQLSATRLMFKNLTEV